MHEETDMSAIDQWKAAGSWFDFNGHSIFYRYLPSSKPTLLCLHGFPTSSYDYRKIWARLGEHFSLLAYDMIGYGFSDKPASFSYTTFDQADILEALLDELGIGNLHVLAHDYGNTITLELLARSAEKQKGYEIDSICFLNGALFPETHRPILAQRILISPIGALFGRLIPENAFRRSLASVFGPPTKPSMDDLDEFMFLFNHNGGRKISHKLIRYMTERQTYRERWFDALSNMRQPFRFINGLADPVSGKHLVERFREIIPHQRDIIELRDIGHFPHFEAPEVTLEYFFEFHGI